MSLVSSTVFLDIPALARRKPHVHIPVRLWYASIMTSFMAHDEVLPLYPDLAVVGAHGAVAVKHRVSH